MADSTRPEAPETPAAPASAPAPALNVQDDRHAFIEADDTLQQPQHNDNNDSDNDSSLGDDAISSTASISSSILRYRQENGRTYHAYKDGAYVMPNDQAEQERLDLQHHLFLLTFADQLHLSPAGRDGHAVRHALDIGTGTGLWAMDFADEHPDAQVIGVDLSPIQTDFVPPNVSFQIDDLEEPWTFGRQFDFIYSRMMTSSFADFPRFFQQSYDNLAPGGWLEMVDICPLTSDDGTLAEDMAIAQWLKQLLAGTRAIGRPFDGAYQYEQQMRDVGFTNLKTVLFKWPSNRWPKDPKLKELGMWNQENITSGLEGLSAAVFTRVLGWSKEQLDVHLADVRKDIKNTSIHSYWPILVVYGQKPLDAN